MRPAARLAAAILLAIAPFGAHAQGRLSTLPLGRYLCELPGDATGLASEPVEGAWFDIINASSYSAEGGNGTYLLTGKSVVFTRGPMQGARFERHSERLLRRLDLSGESAKMRCVRTGRTDAA